MIDRMLEWYVDIMFRLDLFFNPDFEDYLTLCGIAGLDPFPGLRDKED